MKLRLVRLNPLTLDPGGFYLMAARSLDGLGFNQFPCRLEYKDGFAEDGRTAMLIEEAPWKEVEFVNEFAQPDEDNDAREVRPEVQVPVYNGSSRNKRSGGNSGSGQT